LISAIAGAAMSAATATIAGTIALRELRIVGSTSE
jgi:hypothetical protein